MDQRGLPPDRICFSQEEIDFFLKTMVVTMQNQKGVSRVYNRVAALKRP